MRLIETLEILTNSWITGDAGQQLGTPGTLGNSQGHLGTLGDSWGLWEHWVTARDSGRQSETVSNYWGHWTTARVNWGL